MASSRKHERVFRPISVAEWAGEARKLCFLLASSSANCSSRFSEGQTHCDQPCPYFSGHGKKIQLLWVALHIESKHMLKQSSHKWSKIIETVRSAANVLEKPKNIKFNIGTGDSKRTF